MRALGAFHMEESCFNNDKLILGETCYICGDRLAPQDSEASQNSALLLAIQFNEENQW